MVNHRGRRRGETGSWDRWSARLRRVPWGPLVAVMVVVAALVLGYRLLGGAKPISDDGCTVHACAERE